jgi:hypothetical protein
MSPFPFSWALEVVVYYFWPPRQAPKNGVEAE